jgi:ferric-dicitrate binding protein FerR (iron transport regulator)
MRRPLPSTRLRHLSALALLAALVAAACFGLQAQAEPSQPAQSHAATGR